MSTLYNNKHRIPSARADWWDYHDAGFYFITLCTHQRHHYLGKISNGNHHLSDIGKIVCDEWLKTPDIRADMNLVLGEFVVMPDHFHAIIGIGVNRYNHPDIMDMVGNGGGHVNGIGNTDGNGGGSATRVGDTGGRDAMHRVSTGAITTQDKTQDKIITTDTTNADDMKPLNDILNAASTNKKNKFGPQSKNLASIVRGFKSAVTQRARLLHADFAWQPRYHDHIIRDDKEFQRISAYIQRNPSAWRKRNGLG